MLNKLFLILTIFLIFFVLGGAIIASNCEQGGVDVKMNYDIPKNTKLKVIKNLEYLDEESLETEIKNVGKFYADIKISEMHNKCSPVLFFDIYDEKVIVSNGKYIYQFKYDVFLSPFSTTQSETVRSYNYLIFRKLKAVSMYLEFVPNNGLWEIVNEGKYFAP